MEVSSVSQFYEKSYIRPPRVVCCVGLVVMRKSHLYGPGSEVCSFARSIRIYICFSYQNFPHLPALGVKLPVGDVN